MLNGMVQRILLQNGPPQSQALEGHAYEEQLAASTGTLQSLQFDVLASVPQHRGYVRREHGAQRSYGQDQAGSNEHIQARFIWDHLKSELHGEEASESSPSLPLLRMHGGYLLPWPLFMVGSMDITSRSTREWIIKNLSATGEEMGVRQALNLAHMLEKTVQ